jgi:hypothetical protein
MLHEGGGVLGVDGLRDSQTTQSLGSRLLLQPGVFFWGYWPSKTRKLHKNRVLTRQFVQPILAESG